jgi:hypothetical protein
MGERDFTAIETVAPDCATKRRVTPALARDLRAMRAQLEAPSGEQAVD